jgi:hypothetical protein
MAMRVVWIPMLRRSGTGKAGLLGRSVPQSNDG